jgi:DNA-binding NarL/FixJ family response regulator
MTLDCLATSSLDASVLFGPASESTRIATADALLPLLWAGLKRGTFVVKDADTDRDCARLTLRSSGRAPHPRLGFDAESVAVDAVLRGSSQKEVAMEHGVAFSTLALNLRNATERMGLRARFSRVPLALPLLAQAVAHPGLIWARLYGDLPTANECCTVVFERTESAFEDALSFCELAVARSLLEGKSYEEISAERGTSLRTIANQVCSVGRKLQVRGRFDLLRASVERRAPTIPAPAHKVYPTPLLAL